MIQLKHLITEQVGAAWSSCRAWNAAGGTNYWNGEDGRPKITIKFADSGFQLRYVGKGSGYAISHAKGGKGDSLHQAFNVVVCDANKYLMKGGLKPDVNNIDSNCNKTGAIYDMNIWIPFLPVDKQMKYQLNHRGGWGHDPGPNAVLSAVAGKAKNLEGPGKVVVNTGGGTITEYFVTYTI
jgi:hypothetical protein